MLRRRVAGGHRSTDGGHRLWPLVVMGSPAGCELLPICVRVRGVGLTPLPDGYPQMRMWSPNAPILTLALQAPAGPSAAPRAGPCSEALSGEGGSHSRKVSEQDLAPVVSENGGRKEWLGSSYLTMLQSGSIRTMVGSSTYRNSRSCWILALSTCTVTFMSSTSSEDVVLQMM